MKAGQCFGGITVMCCGRDHDASELHNTKPEPWQIVSSSKNASFLVISQTHAHLSHRPQVHAYPLSQLFDFHFGPFDPLKWSGWGSSATRGLATTIFPKMTISVRPYLPLAAGRQRDVHEAASVLLPLVGAALGTLRLLLLLDFGGLRLDFACKDDDELATVSLDTVTIAQRQTDLRGQDCRELYPY
jgi:hypothetical protein